MRTFVVAPLLVLLSGSTASAAPLEPAHLPEGAKWVIHLDLEALSETKLAEEIRQKRPEMTKEVRRWFQDRYGIDPREDLHALTMFSDTYESHTGTMVLRADYDRDKVTSELENKPDVKKESWRDHTLYTVRKAKHVKHRDDSKERRGADRQEKERRGAERQEKERRGADRQEAAGRQEEGKTTTIILLDGNKAVFASSADRAKAAVELLEGESASLEGKDSELLNELRDGTVVYGAAIELGKITQHEGFFPVLRQHERIYMSVSEENGQVLQSLKLFAQSNEVAEQMKTALEGLAAFGKVWAADSESLTRLMENTEITIDGSMVQAQRRSDAQTVIDGLRDVRQRVERRFGAGGY